MKEAVELIRALAFDRAYQLAGLGGLPPSCCVCGMPTQRFFQTGHGFSSADPFCGSCHPPEEEMNPPIPECLTPGNEDAEKCGARELRSGMRKGWCSLHDGYRKPYFSDHVCRKGIERLMAIAQGESRKVS